MMNQSEKRLCFELADTRGRTFAELSMQSQMSTDFLSFGLDSLVTRGFVEADGTTYTLKSGVREALI